MSRTAAQSRRRYTWSDYRTWNDKKRWEIIGGDAFLMASPTSRHQRITTELGRQMANYFRGKRSQFFNAPLDVVLSEDDVVQPDHLVVCDPNQIKVDQVFGKTDTLVSATFADLQVRLADVFDFPLEPGEEPPVAHEPPAPRYATTP